MYKIHQKNTHPPRFFYIPFDLFLLLIFGAFLSKWQVASGVKKKIMPKTAGKANEKNPVLFPSLFFSCVFFNVPFSGEHAKKKKSTIPKKNPKKLEEPQKSKEVSTLYPPTTTYVGVFGFKDFTEGAQVVSVHAGSYKQHTRSCQSREDRLLPTRCGYGPC
jgi:hypothetical protein